MTERRVTSRSKKNIYCVSQTMFLIYSIIYNDFFPFLLITLKKCTRMIDFDCVLGEEITRQEKNITHSISKCNFCMCLKIMKRKTGTLLILEGTSLFVMSFHRSPRAHSCFTARIKDHKITTSAAHWILPLRNAFLALDLHTNFASIFWQSLL